MRKRHRESIEWDREREGGRESESEKKGERGTLLLKTHHLSVCEAPVANCQFLSFFFYSYLFYDSLKIFKMKKAIGEKSRKNLFPFFYFDPFLFQFFAACKRLALLVYML
jgi:hypothetical protein